ncbi:MAG: hypothetical protein CEO21_284 [Microgenomates group bacterium Gr01-1014_80]|nr:MAG: hypothetical protein CEO21_284 [Microgenomates group bacterium Gr01-1014_80]
MFRRFGVFTKCNVNHSKSNNKKGRENQSQNICIPKSCEIQIHKIPPLNLYAKYKKIIAATISKVKIVHLNEGSIPGNIGDTIANPIQKTEKLISHSDRTEIAIDFLFITGNLTKLHWSVKSRKDWQAGFIKFTKKTLISIFMAWVIEEINYV